MALSVKAQDGEMETVHPMANEGIFLVVVVKSVRVRLYTLYTYIYIHVQNG